jgi:hypothetical protein
MNWLYGKLTKLVADQFNVIVIAILCAGFISGIYIQGESHDDKIDKLRIIYNDEVQKRENEYNNLWNTGNALFQTYQKERANSSLKDQIIEKQHKAIEELLNELNNSNKFDISRWI